MVRTRYDVVAPNKTRCVLDLFCVRGVIFPFTLAKSGPQKQVIGVLRLQESMVSRVDYNAQQKRAS